MLMQSVYKHSVDGITLIVLVIGKAQFRRAMLSCDSSCLTNFRLGVELVREAVCFFGELYLW